jgi:peptide chain release factor subunit 1
MIPYGGRIGELLGMRSQEPDVLSVYLRIEPDPAGLRSAPTRLEAALDRLAEECPDMGPGRRKALMTDMEAVRPAAERAREWLGRVPLRGVALFAASGLGLFDEVRLPSRPVELAVLDTRPYLRPLLALHARCEPYCVVVVDAEHAWIATSGPDGVRQDTRLTTARPRKPDYGGWHGLVEYRVRNRAEHLYHRHLRRTADLVRQAMCERGARILVVGGHEYAAPGFLAELTPDLRDRVAGTFVIDPHTMTMPRVRDLAEDVIMRFLAGEARRQVEETVDEHAAGGLAVTGLETCLDAVGERAVEQLFVRVDDRAGGYACDRCGVVSLSAGPCASCEGRTRTVPDIIGEAMVLVIQAGGAVEQVSGGTALDGARAAARVRFPVAPAAADASSSAS